MERITLKACRVNKNLLLKDVAKKMKKSTTWLSLVENGKRDIGYKKLMTLLKIYGVSLDDIFLPV